MIMKIVFSYQLFLYLSICLIPVLRPIESKSSDQITQDVSYYTIGQVEDEEEFIEDDGIRRSLVFVFDNTGSMKPELKKLIEGATKIFNTIHNNKYNVIENFIFMPFNDPGIGPILNTKDETLFKHTLTTLAVNGGGDCPEKALTGIKAALEASLPYSYIFVFTDASAKDYTMIESVLQLVQRKKSQIIFVLTGGCGHRANKDPQYQVYETIKSVSSGEIFHLEKTEVSQVLQYINEKFAGNVVNMISKNYPKSTKHEDIVAVDNTLDKVTVSVVGGNSSVDFKNPKDERVDDPKKIAKVVDLSEVKIFNIIDPEPGNWTLIISSDKDHSLKVTGVSTMEIDMGYIIHDTNSFTETSQRPLKGAQNRMVIRVRNDKGMVSHLNNVVLSNIDGKVLFELALMKVNDKLHIYKSKPFLLPSDEYFSITVNGVDTDGNPIKRTGSTAITPQQPEKPYVTVKSEILAHLHKSVTLKCKFDSLAPVSVCWYKNNEPLQDKQNFKFSNEIQYVIKNFTEPATYVCKAENSIGESTGQTKVNVKESVETSEKNLTISNVNFYLDDSGNGMFSFYMGDEQFTALSSSKNG